ncbi:MAG: hypothetical protein ACTH31_16605, partial [Pseudoclavibacter sp.]
MDSQQPGTPSDDDNTNHDVNVEAIARAIAKLQLRRGGRHPHGPGGPGGHSGPPWAPDAGIHDGQPWARGPHGRGFG